MIFSLVSCLSKEKDPSLKTWEGHYSYEEQPVKANAGYSMVMEWTLSIKRESGKYLAQLEVNGQQTEMKIRGLVQGNEKTIYLLYEKTTDGMEERLSPGDTLFSLVKEKGKIITRWAALEPRLSAVPPNECTCFVSN